MKPSEIRAELLAQHHELRRIIAATRTKAKEARAGRTAIPELQASLTELSEAMSAHNLREEGLLRDVIVSVDAWGPARAAIMSEEHIHEHARLRDALGAIRSTPTEIAGIGVVALIDWILEHMDREESVLLAEDVLRDDEVVPNQSGG
jgi:hypothetical protein